MRIDFLLIHNQKKRQYYQTWCWAIGLEMILVLIIACLVHRMLLCRIEVLQRLVAHQEAVTARSSVGPSPRPLETSVSAFLSLFPRLAEWLPRDGVVDHITWNRGVIDVVGHCLSFCTVPLEWPPLERVRLNQIQVQGEHCDRFVLKMEDVRRVAAH